MKGQAIIMGAAPDGGTTDVRIVWRIGPDVDAVAFPPPGYSREWDVIAAALEEAGETVAPYPTLPFTVAPSQLRTTVLGAWVIAREILTRPRWLVPPPGLEVEEPGDEPGLVF